MSKYFSVKGGFLCPRFGCAKKDSHLAEFQRSNMVNHNLWITFWNCSKELTSSQLH